MDEKSSLNNKKYKRISKDAPLFEIILRKYDLPFSDNKRDLIKRFCLSLGLLNPGDFRDIIVDILYSFIINHPEGISLKQVEHNITEIRKQNDLELFGVSSSNIQRQIRRLKEIGIITKKDDSLYYLSEISFEVILKERIYPYLIRPSLRRIKEYCLRIDEITKYKKNQD
jgi:hypothetical protein